MKFRIAITLAMLMSAFVAATKAQSNCCNIQVSGVNRSVMQTTVPPDAGGPGGTYISSETDTYGIACINSATGKTCNLASSPSNVVTATGKGANVNGNFIACNPSFVTATSQASPTSGAAATFTDVGTSYIGVDSNGVCTKNAVNPSDSSSCVVVACSSQPTSCPSPKCPADGGDPIDWCAWPDTGCPPSESISGYCCKSTFSPVIIDLSGNGFLLTSAQNGVLFDISGTGHPIQMGWTASGADNAFLALPGADGLVHNGKQLFGNFAPQPPSSTPNGFAALAVYDLPANGGNGDGMIDAGDGLFASLRLWIDANHDGIAQPEELHTLPSLGVNSISLNYKADQRTDQYGNVFHYRAQVNPGGPTSTGRVAYDVFFVTSQPTSKNIPRGLIPRGGGLIPTDAHKCVVPVPAKGGVLSTSGR